MKKELPHSVMLAFHFFYCRGKKKSILFVINTLFFVSISTNKRQRGNLGIIFLPISLKGIQSLQQACLLCQTYVLLLYSIYISSEILLIPASSSRRKTRSHSFISKFCFTCITNSECFSVSHNTLQAWLHGSTDHK